MASVTKVSLGGFRKQTEHQMFCGMCRAQESRKSKSTACLTPKAPLDVDKEAWDNINYS